MVAGVGLGPRPFHPGVLREATASTKKTPYPFPSSRPRGHRPRTSCGQKEATRGHQSPTWAPRAPWAGAQPQGVSLWLGLRMPPWGHSRAPLPVPGTLGRARMLGESSAYSGNDRKGDTGGGQDTRPTAPCVSLCGPCLCRTLSVLIPEGGDDTFTARAAGKATPGAASVLPGPGPQTGTKPPWG